MEAFVNGTQNSCYWFCSVSAHDPNVHMHVVQYNSLNDDESNS